MVEVRCDSVTKIFRSAEGETTAVDDVDLTIEDGTFATLLGPSGCGKTTLLRMLAGLEMPSDGAIYFDDDEMTNVEVQDRNVSMVFQSIALFPFMTVRENIEYGLKYRDVDKGIVREKVKEMAEKLEIDDLLDKKPSKISGGQRQRVSLARSLVREPDLFLLDEPMAALDAQLKEELRSELKELHKEFQTTTLYVTHDQEEAMSLSEEVIVLNDGKIKQQSPPHDTYTKPQNVFVAQFIGSPNINIFSGYLNEECLVIEELGQEIELPDGVTDEIRLAVPSGDVYVGIRPPSFETTNRDNAFSSEVKLKEHMGENVVLHLRLPENGREIRAVIPSQINPDIGESIKLGFDLSDPHIFDANSGEAITSGVQQPPSSRTR